MPRAVTRDIPLRHRSDAQRHRVDTVRHHARMGTHRRRLHRRGAHIFVRRYGVRHELVFVGSIHDNDVGCVEGCGCSLHDRVHRARLSPVLFVIKPGRTWRKRIIGGHPTGGGVAGCCVMGWVGIYQGL